MSPTSINANVAGCAQLIPQCPFAGHTPTSAIHSTSPPVFEHVVRRGLPGIPRPFRLFCLYCCPLLYGCVYILSVLATHCLYWRLILHLRLTFVLSHTINRHSDIYAAFLATIVGQRDFVPYVVGV